ncbi:DUF3080 family protein [Halomonas sp. V046]|uniref:DUF3080 family protein n=1 Tax=Halomonas sp. V046 TaxID=3459611 RepID=UPI004044A748
MARQMAAYQDNLAAHLDQPAPARRPIPNIGAFPGTRELTLDVDETREGLLNVFALRGCQITNLVAERNNQLGRVAPPSQRWLYELRLWRRLSACVTTDVVEALGAEDRARLARLTRIKTQQLPTQGYNALVASEEWAGNFSRASSPIDPQDLAEVQRQLPALQYLTDAIKHQYDRTWMPDSAILEGHLKTLRERPLSAELLRSLLLAAVRLEEINRVMAAAQEQRCQGNGAPRSAQSIAFDPALSAWTTRLGEAAGTWFEAIDRLLDAHVAGTDALRRYRQEWLDLDSSTTPLGRFDAARQDHQHLQHTLSQRCNSAGDLR